MNKSARMFSRSNYATGVTEWFFKSREGISGPFNSEQAAVWALDEYLKRIAAAKQADKGAGLSKPVLSETGGQAIPVRPSNTRLN